jgi:hypothetical protein
MTTSTKDHPPDASSDAAIAPDLESRIRRRRAELIGKLRELRAEAHLEAAAAGDKLKAKLSEVGHILTNELVDGWAGLGDTVKRKLEHWLAESERSLTAQNLPTNIGNHDDRAGRALHPSGSAGAGRARRPVTAK